MANKWTNGIQKTVTWNVDDMKISHKDKSEVTRLIDYLEDIYERMAVQIGEYLKILEWNWIKASMRKYLSL